jgi:hypothetical protein
MESIVYTYVNSDGKLLQAACEADYLTLENRMLCFWRCRCGDLHHTGDDECPRGQVHDGSVRGALGTYLKHYNQGAAFHSLYIGGGAEVWTCDGGYRIKFGPFDERAFGKFNEMFDAIVGNYEPNQWAALRSWLGLSEEN